MELKQDKKITSPGRRKFFAISGLLLALGFLRSFVKNPRMTLKKLAPRKLKISLHPAQFYKKLYSDRDDGGRT
jgi:hypothetical protein